VVKSVKGIYDGREVRPLEPIRTKKKYRVEIDFIEELKEDGAGEDTMKLAGLLADLTEEEFKEFQEIAFLTREKFFGRRRSGL